MLKSYVIVISGVTASGKTTLIQELSHKLPDCSLISFDDYSIDALPSAPPIDTPIQEAVNQYDISMLMDDFLKVYNKYHFVLVDFPFGYKHDTLKPYIDKVIYIKTPLDVCFARQILRDYTNKDGEQIRDWVKTYLNFARPIFVNHDKYISSDADLVIDGLLPLDKKVGLILNEFKLDNLF